MNWGIFDSNIFNEVTYQAPNHAVFVYSDPREIRELENALGKARESKGKRLDVKDKAGSVRPVYCAIPLKNCHSFFLMRRKTGRNFIAAVDRYNEICDAGKDTDFGKDSGLLHPIRKAHFYACGNRKDSHHPGDTRSALEVFRIHDAEGNFFDISDQSHVTRGTFTVGKAEIRKSGYFVEGGCIGCGQCLSVCPQKCIDISGISAVIDQNRCLHCGRCEAVCPAGAIKKYA